MKEQKPKKGIPDVYQLTYVDFARELKEMCKAFGVNKPLIAKPLDENYTAEELEPYRISNKTVEISELENYDMWAFWKEQYRLDMQKEYSVQIQQGFGLYTYDEIKQHVHLIISKCEDLLNEHPIPVTMKKRLRNFESQIYRVIDCYYSIYETFGNWHINKLFDTICKETRDPIFQNMITEENLKNLKDEFYNSKKSIWELRASVDKIPAYCIALAFEYIWSYEPVERPGQQYIRDNYGSSIYKELLSLEKKKRQPNKEELEVIIPLLKDYPTAQKAAIKDLEELKGINDK